MTKKRIVVTGMSVVSCFGNDVDTFYENLIQGRSGVKKITKFPVDEYSTQIAAEITDFDPGVYLDKKQARRLDEFIKYTVVAGKRALEHAKRPLDSLGQLEVERCGIIIGSGMGGMGTFVEGVETLSNKGYKRITPFFIPYIITNMGGGLLGIETGFMGPNYSISTACATSNYCIASAANHIRRGDADLMLCGGAEAPIIPIGLTGFIACRAVSSQNEHPEKASRPWDINRDGFVMGEGAGVLVLESLEHAQKRGAHILAEYLGGAMNCDAFHMTAPREDGLGVQRCMELAIADAEIEKERITHINAHATSTPAGDMGELRSIATVLGDHIYKVAINSTKSMVGHCLGAAGGVEAVAVIKAIETGKVHPTINVDDPEPEVDGINIVPNTAQDIDIDVAVSNSFGFGGHNSSIIFGKYRG